MSQPSIDSALDNPAANKAKFNLDGYFQRIGYSGSAERQRLRHCVRFICATRSPFRSKTLIHFSAFPSYWISIHSIKNLY